LIDASEDDKKADQKTADKKKAPKAESRTGTKPTLKAKKKSKSAAT